MCRKNLVVGMSLMAFAAGVLVGGWITSWLVRWLLALGCGGAGFLLLDQKRWYN